MDKFEAKKLLQKLDTIQNFLSEKDLPRLERKLDAEADNLKRNMFDDWLRSCLLYTSPSPRDRQKSRMPSSA